MLFVGGAILVAAVVVVTWMLALALAVAVAWAAVGRWFGLLL